MLTGDCLDILKQFPDNHFDLCITSPPYEAQRKYGELGFNLTGQDWVDWAVERYLECVRVTKGLVAWVIEGQTRAFQWSATPALLMADLHRKGVKLRKPPVYHRVGIPGSGGPDWLRNDYEFIVCSSKGRLPWSEPTATGHPPKYAPGGKLSHRKASGDRVDQRTYSPPKLANPGNVIRCKAGGGHLGSKYAHENEAPFPISLVEVFIKSFCVPGGMVLDPFCGSGTTLVAASSNHRHSVGIDIRTSQIALSAKRYYEEVYVKQ
jgi:DNA modification methylase